MATHPNSSVDATLGKHVGSAGFSISNTNTATLGSVNLTAQQLRDLVDSVGQAKYEVKVVSGSVVILPKSG